MIALYSLAQERELDRMKFLARLLGADIDDSDSSSKTVQSARQERRVPSSQSETLFKHPSEYAKLTDVEREELTERMLGSHQQALRSTPLGRGRF